MIEEYNQLRDRLSKLETAIHKEGFREKVGDKQYYLMVAQHKAIYEYCDILKIRIEDLGIEFEE